MLVLDTNKANNAKRLLDKTSGRCVGIKFIEATRSRHRTDESDGSRDDLFSDRRTGEVIELDVHDVITSGGGIEFRDWDDFRLRPGIGDVLTDGDAVGVDLVKELVNTEGDTDLEGVLRRNEVTAALLLEFRNRRVEVSDDLVEVLTRPRSIVALRTLRHHIKSGEVGVVEDTVSLVVTEVITEEGDRVGVELEGEAEGRTVRLIGGRLLSDSRKTGFLQSTREDTLSEAHDGAVFLVEVVTGVRSLSVVAVRTDTARELADTEDDGFLIPLTVGGAAKELVSRGSLSHNRDDFVHPVLEELDGDLSRRSGNALGRERVHHILNARGLVVEGHAHEVEVLHSTEFRRSLIEDETFDWDLRQTEFAF